MKPYRREYPPFALCGLNCGLCPMYHISEQNHCTGCGGEGRPSCAILRCSREHGAVEFCFQCAAYPCERYEREAEFDSFVSARNVLRDNERARGDLDGYKAMLDEKIMLLRKLLREYNDGRRKSFFCLAVNLLELRDVRAVMDRIALETAPEAELKERAELAVRCFRELAEQRGIPLKLRKLPKKK